MRICALREPRDATRGQLLGSQGRVSWLHCYVSNMYVELLTGVMLVYHDFRGNIASKIGTHASRVPKSKQPRQRVIVTRPTAALKCGLGLRRVQESVTLSTSASTKRWYVH